MDWLNDEEYSILFPAYAGVILYIVSMLLVAHTFPRVCGGDPLHPLPKVPIGGFSPRMRG